LKVVKEGEGRRRKEGREKEDEGRKGGRRMEGWKKDEGRERGRRREMKEGEGR
jgi:hypothetical protein